jgi:tRNA-splicing ligase RtcB (3'-phosphate/5'-hydroxy nucleic acid ligase)
MSLRRVGSVVWEMPAEGGMRVPGRIFASEPLLLKAQEDRAVQQVCNVAHLPGIVDASMAMPDIHWGYGFPIGGVAATDIEGDGVVSPGGVGFDICCGVRLLRSSLTEGDLDADRRETLMAELDRRIPRGLGAGSIADAGLVRSVLTRGAEAVVAAGYGRPDDLERCEEGGVSSGADPDAVSARALERGAGQLGSLGGGNHFLEIQVVDEVVDAAAAAVFGLGESMICVMIHTGSRGLGHQTCTDQLKLMERSPHHISVPDRQLACVPVGSREGETYLTAMAVAANFAWANRQVIGHEARQAFGVTFGDRGRSLGVVYDVAHNLAKIEDHELGGRRHALCVHRKGATRALPPGHPDLPTDLLPTGQPVLVPGSMGTASWVLAGAAGNPAFATAAHGAGRMMSRKAAKRQESGKEVMEDLARTGIEVRPGSVGLLSEEAPYAYKDVDEVARVCEEAGLARRVARLRPIGVLKG